MPIFRRDFHISFLAAVVTFSLGCGDGASEAGTPVETYPAFLPDAPQVIRGDAGGVLTAPTVRLIAFAGDPLQAEIAGLLERVRNPPYWMATTHEYGVGPLSIGAPIVVDEAVPASLDSSQIEPWLTGKLDGTHADFGTPDERTIYLVVYPAPTTLTNESQPACGFHGHLLIPHVVPRPPSSINYAAVSDCTPMMGQEAQIDAIGHTISHELIETATDPDFATPQTSGYGQVDSEHVAWQYFYDGLLGSPPTGIEICDLCDTQIGPPELEYAWSNAAIRAGRNPCGPTRPYFNAMPVLPDDVGFGRPSLPVVHTKGVIVPVGESRTIDVDLYSDREMAVPWKVSAATFETLSLDVGADASGFELVPRWDVDFSFDRTSGSNGATLHLTIRRVRPSPYGSAVVVLESNSTDEIQYWPFIVGQ